MPAHGDPFVLGVSERAYSSAYLKEVQKQNVSGVEFAGERLTLYEAEQEQRHLETSIRYEKE